MSNNQKLLPAPQSPTLGYFDEAGYYFGGNDDGIREELRKVDGVPNAAYVVKDGQVFVFEKLVQIFKEQRKLQPGLPLADLARSLLALATVSAQEAVDSWGIVPEPYVMAGDPLSGLTIRHRPFNARLPGTFQTKADVQDAFVSILTGGIQSGDGEFAYKGQPMTLCESLDDAALPARPTIQSGLEPTTWVCTALDNVCFEPGFQPVSEAAFDRLKALEAGWKDDSARAAQYACRHAAEVWERATGLRLETLNDPAHELPDYGHDDFAELRSFYPELSMLSDGSLYTWFDAYQEECQYISGWTASRDDGFLFCLLGKVVGREFDCEAAKDVGTWVGYALLRGDSLDAALAFGRAATEYDSALARIACRVAPAMRFVTEDKRATDLRGRAVTTTMDVFRKGRITNVIPLVVRQTGATA